MACVSYFSIESYDFSTDYGSGTTGETLLFTGYQCGVLDFRSYKTLRSPLLDGMLLRLF